MVQINKKIYKNIKNIKNTVSIQKQGIVVIVEKQARLLEGGIQSI